jgi:hypothetical protein
MPAFKMSASRIFAGLAASAFFTPAFCVAATLVVNDETPLDVTTPPGFTYTVAGSDGSLAVSTSGFLFCANFPPDQGQQPTPVTVMPQHGDWRLPVAQDVQSVAYNSGVLGVNRSVTSTLVCHSVGAQGEVASAFSDGVFRNGYESKATEQFGNLVNWIPSAGFDWNTPDWSLVPTDPCNPSAQQPAEIVEDVTCAAVAGLRPAGVGSSERAATLWTGTDGVNFFYVARVDARFGAQSEADGNASQQIPLGNGDAPEGTTGAVLNIVDAYDRGVVGVGGGYLGDSGQWCVLSLVPNALDGNMCVGAPFSGALNGPLTDFPSIHLSIPPLGIPSTSFYIVFIRPIVGPPPSINEPAVAVSILLEPSVTAEGGDKFKGDDVAFGFLPTSQGFPWMHGQ